MFDTQFLNSVFQNHNDISLNNSILRYSSAAQNLKFNSEVCFLASDRNSNCMENLVQDFLQKDSLLISRLNTEAGEEMGREYDSVFGSNRDSNKLVTFR